MGDLGGQSPCAKADEYPILPYPLEESLRDSFASADMFVVSLKPGLAGYIVPSKLYGLLAAGRPYVAAVKDTCEVAAISQKYACGLVVAPSDAKGLAQQILSLYHDRTMAQRLGVNARQAALVFDRSPQVRAYYELFGELTAVPVAAR
jgi:colanic acid biosynthesis glycosyl transferase WcaI